MTVLLGYFNLVGQVLKLSEASAYMVGMPLLPYHLLHALNQYCASVIFGIANWSF